MEQFCGRAGGSVAPVPSSRRKVAVVHGVPAGLGGLGQQVASVLDALADYAEVHAFGPGHTPRWPLPTGTPHVEWHHSPPGVAQWLTRFKPLRRYSGLMQFQSDRAVGQWAAKRMQEQRPDLCYVFTQVGLETLAWARRDGTPSVVDSPNGHLRNFRSVNQAEALRLGPAEFRGHPSSVMVRRVEREYALADRMRVSSQWSRASMIAHRVTRPIAVFQQPLDLARFCPARDRAARRGPLRACFVGSLDLRKGFVNLLRAIRLLGPDRISLEMVGATGDRLCRQLLARERATLNLHCAPRDPVPTLHDAEIFVLPTLEDGSPFAVAEAMACGVPVIVSECCGAAEWVREGESGWIVRGGSVEALAVALDQALARRAELPEMGRQARRDTEHRAGLHCLEPLREWLLGDMPEVTSG